jgi:hypothetical protein
MNKPHLFKCGRYWVCAASRFDHHIMRGSLGGTPSEAYTAFIRRTHSFRLSNDTNMALWLR